MANRTTVKNNIIAQNVPTVTNAILTGMLNTELADNVKFREDVAVAQSSGVTNITVNFTGRDRVDLTRTGGALNITVSGIADGEEVDLLITKTAGQPITWVGVTDITPVKANVTAVNLVLYSIRRKGANYYAKAWVETVKQATDTNVGVLATASVAEHNALTVTNKAVVPGRIPIATTTQRGIQELATVSEANALSDAGRLITPATIPLATTSQRGVVELATNAETLAGTDSTRAVTPNSLQSPSWQTLSLNANWSGTVQYFKDAVGNVHIRTSNLAHNGNITGTTGISIASLPVGYRPGGSQIFLTRSNSPAFNHFFHGISVTSASGLVFTPEPSDYTDGYIIAFYIIYRAEA